MSRLVWRIATDARTSAADDMAGTGAKLSGGRWNNVGVPIIYAASSRAIACLETVVHVNATGLPLNRYLVEVDVPDEVWRNADVASVASLVVGWDAEPAAHVSVDVGSVWIASKRSAILRVPSVIVPEEENALINPAHPDAGKITARKVRRWLYDPRSTT